MVLTNFQLPNFKLKEYDGGRSCCIQKLTFDLPIPSDPLSQSVTQYTIFTFHIVLHVCIIDDAQCTWLDICLCRSVLDECFFSSGEILDCDRPEENETQHLNCVLYLHSFVIILTTQYM